MTVSPKSKFNPSSGFAGKIPPFLFFHGDAIRAQRFPMLGDQFGKQGVTCSWTTLADWKWTMC